MKIWEKYNLQETSDHLIFQPFKPLQKLSQWFLIGIFIVAILFPLLRSYVDAVVLYSVYILLGYFFLHSLYDILIRAKITYTFDLKEKSIYRESPISKKRKILKLEEAVIFVSSEMGSWHYSIGARKSQFVKSYSISENFSSGKKSDRKQAEYENQILVKIQNMIDTSTTM
ncbi:MULTISPECIES: hypothetical protein [Flavobacterium]|uniref:YcxB family protein n=1 Tax=Flavobacterium endoglycinae TaxID=2816357 RepID=A0ABX7QCM3_9FLAO|nr:MULTISPECIES: hypothetical protein [Flavobacterium]QSW88785.1 hypothetical protein J0383_21415 [Flavobacterium endoglycinae]